MDKKVKIREWILELPKRGRITFSTDDIYRQYPALNKEAVTSAIRRLVEKGKIQSVWHGFYVVVPVEYELKGVVSPIVYIDQLMNYLQKDYYIGLLNAASFYGAAHQQPQEFSVITGGKTLRDKFKNGVKINFVSKKEIPRAFIRKNTTKTGYISVSSPELTALDLLLYQKEIGGLSRAGTVLNELVEEMDFNKITPDFLQFFPATAIQRFGYLLDEILEQSDKAQILLEKVKQAGIKFRKTLLKSEIQVSEPSEYEQNEIWKIVINEEIEIDE
ncbi:MAG: type IV toxin-antitoxin system AbiEi family antitoxin [Prevotellaceae bacterium]|jgi:predicted transcriptional regulator of viral defense system|nr:type IV toxin-antitoxin system AbiEi family antitoxin [Prevotellaceae bacterium]